MLHKALDRLFRFFESRVDAFPDREPRALPADLVGFVRACARGTEGRFAWMVALTALSAGFEAFLFSVLGRLVDTMSRETPAQWWPAHRIEAILLGIGILLSIALAMGETLVRHQSLAINFPMRLRWLFHRQLLGQSLSFFQDEFAGRITTKVMQTALAVRDSLFMLCSVAVTMVVYVITMVAGIGSFSVTLVWPFLAWLLLYSLQCWYFVPRLATVGKHQADARSLMTGRITDAYSNIAVVKLFSHAHREADYARRAMQDFMVPGHQQMRLVSLFDSTNHVLTMGLLTGLATTAFSQWADGKVGPGPIAAATAMALRLQGMSHWIMWEMTSLFENVGTIQDGLNTLSKSPTIVDRPDAEPLHVRRGEVRIEGLSFGYGDGRRAVIDDLDLVIRPGERIGLVGRSGAGKTTLVNLLLRFHEPQSGRILIDGQDIASVTQESLRAQIGMVTQDPSLLHRSVAENIAYGLPDAGRAAIETAARRAHAFPFIDGLNDPKGRTGFEAHVGERGVKLSGGQRQRIAIARVMLKDAPILLLDEATSALDSEVELAIQQSLDELMQGKTVIAIAHRLSTIAALDRLVVLDEGRIAEQGDHASLLAQGGLYARLWAHQSGGFLGEP